MPYKKVLIRQLKVGDIVNLDTGYRPFDSEDCEILEIEKGLDPFDEEVVRCLITSYRVGTHWTTFRVWGQYGNKPKFEYHTNIKEQP